MNRHFGWIMVLYGLFLNLANAQFSGYGSLSNGFNANPLYNYECRSDQMRQSYLELKFDKKYAGSRLNVTYVGGLVLFNQIEERNYYEQYATGTYTIAFTNSPEKKGNQRTTGVDTLSTETGDEDSDDRDTLSVAEDSDSTEAETPAEKTITDILSDSTAQYLDMVIKAGGRHDKAIFEEFDNFGTEFSALYKTSAFADYNIRTTGNINYRDYVHLPELSNITILLSTIIGNRTHGSVDYSIRGGGGFKRYLQIFYDTAKFEPKRSYVEKPTGKGKPGAKIVVPSTKLILTNPGSVITYQINLGLNMATSYKGASMEMDVVYRNNLGNSTRLIAQFVNSSYLIDDIYNDFMSYGGPELSLRYTQKFPMEIEAIVSGEIQNKTFGSPSVNLLGEETDDHRQDLRSQVELYLQKFINVSDHTGMGFFVSASTVRNQSNDAYNDFSGWSISGGIGIGLY
jgi:hypothetical protein